MAEEEQENNFTFSLNSVNNMDVRLEDVREPEMTMLLKLNWI